MAREKWKCIKLDVIGEYMRVLTPHVPEFEQLTQKQFYTCAARLSQEQFDWLRSEGYRGNVSTSPLSGFPIYNFKRPALSKAGALIKGPEVFGRDMRPFTLPIGSGSRVMLVLEYGPHGAGKNADGSTYKAGFIFWIGAVQVIEHVVFDESQEDRSLASQFETYDAPPQLQGAAAELQAYPAAQAAPAVNQPGQQQVPPPLSAPPARQAQPVQRQPAYPPAAAQVAQPIAPQVPQYAQPPYQPPMPPQVPNNPMPAPPAPAPINRQPRPNPAQPLPTAPPVPHATPQDYQQARDGNAQFDDDIPF